MMKVLGLVLVAIGLLVQGCVISVLLGEDRWWEAAAVTLATLALIGGAVLWSA